MAASFLEAFGWACLIVGLAMGGLMTIVVILYIEARREHHREIARLNAYAVKREAAIARLARIGAEDARRPVIPFRPARVVQPVVLH